MMIKLTMLVKVLLLLFAAQTLAVDETYLQKNRIEYVKNSLLAFKSTPYQQLINAMNYISVVDRNNCRSNLTNLRVECLLTYARDNCKGARGKNAEQHCTYYSDSIIVNRLSETRFLTKSERYRLMKNSSKDIRSAFADRLTQKYARIVTQFSLSDKSQCDEDDLSCLAKGLDSFCLDYTNQYSISWQYCVSAALWFMGTAQ